MTRSRSSASSGGRRCWRPGHRVLNGWRSRSSPTAGPGRRLATGRPAVAGGAGPGGRANARHDHAGLSRRSRRGLAGREGAQTGCLDVAAGVSRSGRPGRAGSSRRWPGGWGSWPIAASDAGRILLGVNRHDGSGDRGGVGLRRPGTDPDPVEPSGARITVATSRAGRGPSPRRAAPEPAGRIDLACEPFDADRSWTAAASLSWACRTRRAWRSSRRLLAARGARHRPERRLSAHGLRRSTPSGTSHAHTDPTASAMPSTACPSSTRANPARRPDRQPRLLPADGILGLAPLIAGRPIERPASSSTAKSGVCGAGRTPKLTTHFPECNESLSAYSIGKHRHTPEIDQVLTDVAGEPGRGDLHPAPDPDGPRHLHHDLRRAQGLGRRADLLELYRAYYAGSPFIRVVNHLPATKDSAFTNFCDITVRVVRGKILILACLDNLVKGAAGSPCRTST